MITISLCMIVKDEASCLRNCLDSVKDLVDEMIVVDTGSTDGTQDIIKEYTGSVPSFEWINDFSAARNYAFSLATKDYILWLDADDILKKEDQDKFRKLKEILPASIDVVTMIYDITFNEKGECTLSVPRDKLVKNNKGFFWRYFVHEELVVSGRYLHSDIHITHTSDHGHYSRYLANYEKRLADGYALLPHEKYFYGGELFMSGQYEKCIQVLNEFLANPSENSFEVQRAHEFLIQCYEFIHQEGKGISAILSLFLEKTPSAKDCYALGKLLQSEKRYSLAVFWYQLAADPSSPATEHALDTQISAYLQLCVCYYAMGDEKKARKANEKVLSLDPNNASGLFNKEFFDTHK